MSVTQRNVTRNQSTADYDIKKIFIFDNRFVEGIFKNVTNSVPVLQAGMLVARSATIPGGLIPVTSANLADVIGVCAVEGQNTLATDATINVNYCAKGTIDGNMLVLPATVTLDTVVGTKVLRDVLESLGLHVDTSSVQHTKFDN